MTDAYSYVRFSSTKQELGDSLRRQVKLATDYAKRHGLNLSTESYHDLGVSAFKGKNAADGKLRTFINAVDEGIIKPGSMLLVEHLDRLSRDEIDEALELFFSIIRRGITIVTLSPEHVYSKEIIKKDRGISLMIGISLMVGAHDEVAKRSVRVKEAWAEKKKRGGILTKTGPAWLKYNSETNAWDVNAEKVKVVERVFELSLQGHGCVSIAKKLNSEGLKTLQRNSAWSFVTVHKLLSNASVIGTLVPLDKGADAKEHYYPSIISSSAFYTVQEAMARRRYTGGGPKSTGLPLNIFAGKLFCATCKSPIRVIGGKRSYRSLMCASAHANAGCKEGRFGYSSVEERVLLSLKQKVAVILKKAVKVDDPAAALKAERDELKRRLGNLVEALGDVPSPALKERINVTQSRLDKVQQEIVRAVPVAVTKSTLNDAGALLKKINTNALKELTDDERHKLRDAIKQVVEMIALRTSHNTKMVYVTLKDFKEGFSAPLPGKGRPSRKRKPD